VLDRQPNHEVDRDFVLETLALALPGENYERMFETLSTWAQVGDLFEYDDQREHLIRR